MLFSNLKEAKASPVSLELEEPYLSEYHLNSNFDKNTYLSDDDAMPTTGAENGMKLADLRGAGYDDPRREMGAQGWYAPAGAMKQGVYSYIKHFTLYEGNGKMVSVWSNEQAIREIYLKPFEISVKMGKANAVMVSWSFLGHRWTGENSGLLNTVFRDEWGFRGMALAALEIIIVKDYKKRKENL